MLGCGKGLERWARLSVCLAVVAIAMCGVALADAPPARTRAEVAEKVRKLVLGGEEGALESTFDTQPNLSAPYVLGALSAKSRRDALDRINLYRWMVGLPDVSENADWSRQAQATALLMRVTNTISHSTYPAVPDMESELYAQGVLGAGSSCLYLAPGSMKNAAEAIDVYMNDISIDTLGHRRWVIGSTVAEVGIGYVPGSNALKTFGSGGTAQSSKIDYIAWPTPGYNPVTLLRRGLEYSLWLNPATYEKPVIGNVTIQVEHVGGQTETLSGSTLRLNTDGYGDANCLIFSPPSLSTRKYVEGDVVKVTVRGIKATGGGTAEVSYTCNFFDPSVDATAQPPTPVPTQTAGTTAAPEAYTTPGVTATVPASATPGATETPSATGTSGTGATPAPTATLESGATPAAMQTPGAAATSTPAATLSAVPPTATPSVPSGAVRPITVENGVTRWEQAVNAPVDLTQMLRASEYHVTDASRGRVDDGKYFVPLKPGIATVQALDANGAVLATWEVLAYESKLTANSGDVIDLMGVLGRAYGQVGWMSTDFNVAYAGFNGVITMRRPGVAMVSARDMDGRTIAEWTILVQDAASGDEIKTLIGGDSGSVAELITGQYGQLAKTGERFPMLPIGCGTVLLFAGVAVVLVGRKGK